MKLLRFGAIACVALLACACVYSIAGPVAAATGVPPEAMAVASLAAAGAVSTAPHSDALAATEALGAKGAVAPRVSLDDINAAITAENYFTVGSAVEALGQPTNPSLDLLTVCVLTMRNGFVVIGKSAPASPENFDPDKGQTFAREDAIRQLWPLMGFSLRDRLSQN